jgi:predicted nuclease with TOPRIM domain
MIMKYDKMIEITQAESRRKMEVAKKAISGMLDNMERITVAELVKRTGLSRGFFYKNQMVRRELDDAIHRQEAIFKNQHPVIMDKELENTMVDLKLELLRATMQNEELVKSNEQLRQQVEKLQKQLGRKEISLLKRL